MELNILHIADIQIDITTSSQRNDEYVYALEQVKQELIHNAGYDILSIMGDVFERWNANSIEQKIFIDFLHSASPHVKELILIEGNHDVKQKHNTYLKNGKEAFNVTVLDSIVDAVQIENLNYMKHSGIHSSKFSNDLKYVVWGQSEKWDPTTDNQYNPLADGKTYSEWENCQLAGIYTITLFHDMIKNVKNFDGREIQGSDTKTSLDEFRTQLVLAGDIHVPAVYENKATKVIYPSSLVHRNMGEGDKFKLSEEFYKNYQKSNDQHGWYQIHINDDDIQHKFVPIKPYICYHTIDIDSVKKWKEIRLVNNGHFGDVIRIRINKDFTDYAKVEKDLINHVNTLSSNPKIEVQYSSSVLSDNDLDINYLKSDFNSLLTDDKLHEISIEYASAAVDKSRVSVDAKDQIKKYINGFLEKELSHVKRQNIAQRIHFKKGTVSNFMAFGDSIEIDLDNANTVTRIIGSNGIGKTTIFNWLKWMTTDYVSEYQDSRQKKENRLACFNDYRWHIDIVNGLLEFSVNEDHFELNKTLERWWKKDTTDDQKASKGWEDYIDGVPSLSMELKNVVTNEVITDDEKIFAFLEKTFGSLYELNRSIFLNQRTVWDILNKKSADLNSEILRHLGLDIFSIMYSRYDDVKKNFIEKFKQSPYTNDELNLKITEAKESIDKTKESIAVVEDSKADTLGIRDERVESRESLTKQLHQGIETIEYYEEEIEKFKGQISKYLTSIENTKKLVNHYEDKSDDKARKELNDRIEKLTELKDAQIKLKDEAVTKINELNKIIAFEENKIEMRKTEINNELKESIQGHKDVISKNEKIIIEKTAKIKEIKNSINTSVEKLRNTVENDITSTKKDIENNNISIDREQKIIKELNDSIEILENSKVCPECNREYEEGSKEHDHIKTAITEKNEKHENHTVALKFLRESSKTLDIELEKFTNLKTTYFSADFAKSEYAKELEEMSTLAKEIKSSKEEIDNNESIIVEKTESIDVDNDAKIIEIQSSIKELQDQVQTIDKNRLEYVKETNKLVSQISTLHTEKDEIIEMKEKILKLNNAINKLNTDLASNKNTIKDYETNIEFAKVNKDLNSQITVLDIQIKRLNEDIENHDKSITESEKSISVCEDRISEHNISIEENKKHKIASDSLRVYKQILGKKGLQNHIFGIVKDYLNTKLNVFLDDVNFKLVFDEDNVLKQIDLSKSTPVIRKVTFTSGMQTTFMALSLVTVLSNSNASKHFNCVFIDELTGQLNNGENLSYESLNYQNQFIQILDKIKKHSSVFVIDHVIDDLGNENEIEIVPTNDGAQINVL